MIASTTPAKKLSSTTSQTALSLNGICATCIHADGCAYVEAADSPKTFCEQFESDIVSTLSATDLSNLRSMPARLKKESEAIRQAKTLGLCVNCAQVDTCVFPRPEGGIWHCEEYR